MMNNTQHGGKTIVLACALVALAAFGTSQLLRAADAKPKYTTKEVMETLHKGNDSLVRKVQQGNGTSEDFTKLVEYYEALPLNKPSKGEQKSWDEKVAALVKAAKALKASEPGALDSFKAAVNCKACHTVHRPD